MSDAPSMETAAKEDRGRRRREWITTALNTAVLAACAVELAPPVLLGAAVAATAMPSLRRAARAVREGRASVDALDVAALVSALVTGQIGAASFMTWLLGVGDLLLSRTTERARRAIASLVRLEGTEASRVVDGTIERVDASKLLPGDVIVLDPGARVPADALVVSGAIFVDEKALTGESVPRERAEGAQVLAGTVVVEGHATARVQRVGLETTAAKIVAIIEQAGQKPMTLQRHVEKTADRVVLPTFGTAIGAALLSGDVTRLTTVLIPDFGTGIRIALPTTALTAITLASRRGVLIKGAQYLERLSRADVVVFDKTGTLTAGAPRIVDVVEFHGFSRLEIIAVAAAAEQGQAHPVAEAMRRHARALGVQIPEAELGSRASAAGLGVQARVGERDVAVGNQRWMEQRGVALDAAREVLDGHRHAAASTVLVAIDGRLAGALAYADPPRAESADVVRALRAEGRRRVVLLSGDARAPVDAVARAVGVDEAHAELLPADKSRFVEELQRAGRVVAMIGDGINDAPALAKADVGISLHGSTDVALETADVVVVDGGLDKLPVAFEAADRAMADVKRGLRMVIAPNAAAIALGAFGLVNPFAATIANNGSTVVATLASLAPLLRRNGA